MPFKIAIASGKGGTGKTTVAVNLFYFLYQNMSENIQLIDCDVEEPNDAIFFGNFKRENEQDIYQQVPVIDIEKCTFCRKCAEYCEFNAIVVLPSAQFAEINADLCHSCGACKVACNYGAISEIHKPLGIISNYNTGIGLGLVEGSLKIGSSMQTMMIKAVKQEISPASEIVIFDSPPGTSCPVVESVSDADLVILVTEPTPFGLHDLQLTINLLKKINKPFQVIINKVGLGNRDVYRYLNENEIKILGEIPFSPSYASSYATGALLDNIPEDIEKEYMSMIHKIESELIIHEGNNYFKW